MTCLCFISHLGMINATQMCVCLCVHVCVFVYVCLCLYVCVCVMLRHLELSVHVKVDECARKR